MKINKNRLQERLDLLAEIGRDENGGWSRFSFTGEYLEACESVKKWMQEAGMTVEFDAAGNLIGRLNGSNNSLPVVAMGSHIDTVRNGGKFDGNFGVIGAIEVVQTIKENNIKNNNPIEIIVFNEEEGSRFGVGLLGSRAMVGKINKDILYEHKDKEGTAIADGYRAIGLDPDVIEKAHKPKGYYKSYIEMHIEQGKVLDSINKSVGLVEGISGYAWLSGKIIGCSDHAGATPMNLRKDALAAAAEVILATERIAHEIGGSIVATVGKVSVGPNSINVVPGNVEMTFDIRDIDDSIIQLGVKRIKDAFADICRKRNIEGNIDEIVRTQAVMLPSSMIKVTESSAAKIGASYHRMISGAAHDAQMMASITDVAMIFAPSKDGISHSPKEWTEMEDLETCTNTLLNSILELI